MGLTYNGTSITSAKYNGTQLTKITYNGTVVWTSAPAIEPYLDMWSDEQFIFGYYDSLNSSFVKGWDGTLQTSTNKSTWTTFSGTSYATSALGSDSKYHLYLRGIDNTRIAKETNPEYCMFVFYKPDFSSQANNIHLTGCIETILDYEDAVSRTPITMAQMSLKAIFQYQNIVELPYFTTLQLSSDCYNSMFYGCTTFFVSESKISPGICENPLRIPVSGTGVTASDATYCMFPTRTPDTYLAPNVNQIYYTNAIVSGPTPV